MAPPRTRAEATKYRETSRHDDVLEFLRALDARSDHVRLLSFGTSGEGRDLAAVVVSDRNAHTPEEARAQGKVVVMVQANIHAGEVEGKEASLALARDLATGPIGRGVLSRVCAVFVPDANPDGNDRISPSNRRLDLARLEGQLNPPGGVGTRYTGAGWNLNRDFTKQEAAETRATARFFRAWWPHLFVDCHTTDGSIHAFDLTFDTARNNVPLFRRVHARARAMLEACARKIERDHGYRSFWYGNYVREDDPTSGWRTYPALPRFGSHYRGLLGRIDVLLETYSYIDFERRCDVVYAWLLELLRYAARNARELAALVDGEERRRIRRFRAPDPSEPFAVRYGVARRADDGTLLFDYPAHQARGDVAEIWAYAPEVMRARRLPFGALRKYEAPHLRAFAPSAAVPAPLHYFAPARLAERLESHGVEFTLLEADEEREVEAYVVLAMEKTHSPDVSGVVPAPGEPETPLSARPPPRRFETVLDVRCERRRVFLERGTLVVPTAQRAGALAIHLLEPHSDDGFARWEFFDAYVRVGGLFPVYRAIRP
jgi:hypothetical protein